MSALFTPTSFDDVDQFSSWERDLGWDIESTQLSPGANRVGFDHFALPGLLVGHFRSRQSMRNVFALPDGIVVFVICRERLPLVLCGLEVPPWQLFVARSGREHWSFEAAGWDSYEFMVSEELIARTEVFPADFFSRTSRLEEACLPLVQPETSNYLRAIDSLFRAARSEEPLDASECYDVILDGLQRVVDAGLVASGVSLPRTLRRFDLVMQADEFMDAHLAANLTADEIAQSLGVSLRVLSYAFQDAYRVSPYGYFLSKRLHAVRRQLKTGAASVTDASWSHGFHTPSRFAWQYKRLFGELPSQTRARTLRPDRPGHKSDRRPPR